MSMQFESVCPWCGYTCDLVTQLAGDSGVPDSGSVSLCIRCGKCAIFGDDMELRRPSVDEQARLDADPSVRRALSAWSSVSLDARAES